MMIPQNWTPFASRQEKLDYFRAWGLIPAKTNWLRRIAYNGFFADAPTQCSVVGYADSTTPVLLVNGALHAIHADLLAEQQSGAYAQPWPEAYVVFDLETTGLSPTRNKIIEIGALKICDGAEPEQFHTMVDPEEPIPYPIFQLTGIRDEDVRDAPPQFQAVSAFLDFAEDLPLVAHNAKFDTGFVEACTGKKLPNFAFDTVKLAQKAFPGEKHYTLAAMKELLEIDVSVAHRALADVDATNQLFVRCMERLNGNA